MTHAITDTPTSLARPLPDTYLFVPGDRPERFDKALAAGAGAVIIDLEDAVAPEKKSAAREACAAYWRDPARTAAQRASTLVVRINDARSPAFEADLALIRSAGIHGVMLAKTESAAQIERVASVLAPEGYVIALVESARGIANLSEIASAPRVQRIAFGTLDYAVDLSMPHTERGLLFPSCQIAIASRAAGIGSPVAGVTTAIDDEAQLLADFRFARECGFGAKLCIHPRQLAPLIRALAPSAAEVDWARVMAALASGAAAVKVDGKMVDRPVMLLAQDILRRA
jgi:citrate lyase subunit beta / citryl-CoA lyase